MGCIYRLDFPNGKSYVGLTIKSAEHRFKKHANDSKQPKRSTLPVYKAWRKYGAPQLVTIAIVEDYDLAETEIRAIRVFNTLRPNGYNVSYGGDMSPSLNPLVAAKISKTKGTPEARARASAIASEIMGCPKMRERMRVAHSTPELIEASSLRLKAMWVNPVMRERFMAGMQNRTVSEETRGKISATLRTPEVAAKISRKGSVQSEATRLKISITTKGVPKPDHVKQKISNGTFDRWAKNPMPVRCVELDMLFHSARYAAAWCVLQGLTLSENANAEISRATTTRRTAYGYHWGLVDINMWDIPNKCPK